MHPFAVPVGDVPPSAVSALEKTAAVLVECISGSDVIGACHIALRSRHDIIHDDKTAGIPPDVEASVTFLVNTGLFLLGLVNHRYDLRLDPEYWVKATL